MRYLGLLFIALLIFIAPLHANAQASITQYFPAVRKGALLLIGEDPRTHDVVLHLFGLRYIKQGIFDKELGIVLWRLKEMRETADYNVLAYFSENEVREAVSEAEIFVKEIEKFVRDKLEK